jgi:hypothetical protein
VTQIHVKKLAAHFITRANGAEAFSKVAQLEAATITIDLSNVLIFTYPFLDEMIHLALKDDKLKNIIFRTDDDSVLEKLAYIAGTRGIEITVSDATHKKHPIQPKKFTQQKTELVKTEATQNKTSE